MFRLVNLIRRSYFKPRDIAIWKHDVMVEMVPNFITLSQHLDFLKTNENQIPPKVIGDLLNQISVLEIPLDEHWPEICKIVKTIIKDYDRAAIYELYVVTRCIAEVGEANQEFWDMIEHKMMNEGLCRYLTESQAAGLLWSLCKVGKGSDELWKKLEKEVSKFYLSLEPKELQEAIYGLEVSGKGDKNTILKLKSRLRATELTLSA